MARRTLLKASAVIVPPEDYFAGLESKIMAAVQRAPAEASRPAARSLQFRHTGTAAAAMAFLVLGSVMFYWPARSPRVQSLSDSGVSLEERLMAQNAAESPDTFNVAIMGHQGSDDFVLDAVADKLSRMPDQDVRTMLDKMK